MLDDWSRAGKGRWGGGAYRVHHDAVIGVADTRVGSGEWYRGQSKARIVPSGGRTNSLTRTSPGPGSGVSTISILMEFFPGES